MLGEEPVELFLDCWRKVFSLKTLGGGYVRYFLLFTPNGVVKVETSHVGSASPGSGFVLHETFGRGDPASHLFWGAVFMLLEKALAGKRKKEEETVKQLAQTPTVGDFLNSLDEIRKKLSIRKAEVKEYIPYYLLERVEVKKRGSGARIVFVKGGKKETYEVSLGSSEDVNKVVEILSRLIGPGRLKVS